MGGIVNAIVSFFSDIFNGIINFFVDLLNNLLGGIGDVITAFFEHIGLTLEIPAGVFDIFNELTIGVGYIVPVSALLPIPLFMLAFYIAKLIFAIYQLIAATLIRRVKIK